MGWHPHSSSHYIILSLQLKFSFIQNFTQSSLATLVYSKDYRPLGKALEQQDFSLKTQATVVTPSKSSIPQKRTQNEINKKQMQIMAEICQNRPAGRNRFFRPSSVAQIKKCSTNESYLTYCGIYS